jgi:hypothetical protein
MSKVLITNYTFDASAQQIALTDYSSISIERLLMVTNITDNTVIYFFKDPSRGGTASGNVVTLTYDTSTMSDTDALQIFYDDESLDALIDALYELIRQLSPLAGAVAMVGGQALRTQGVGTFAVSGPQTSANFIASHALGGVNYPNKTAAENLTAQANINNCTGA